MYNITVKEIVFFGIEKFIMKIYTGFGDKGYTSLFGGEKVKKSSIRVDVYGTLDELNSLLGVVHAKNSISEVNELLTIIQNDLFVISAEIATPENKKSDNFRLVNKRDIMKIEHWIDEFNAKVPELKQFILPGGTETASFIHLARTVTRRAERLLVKLMENSLLREVVLIYLNRLSDLLFVMARYENQKSGGKEIFWSKQ